MLFLLVNKNLTVKDQFKEVLEGEALYMIFLMMSIILGTQRIGVLMTTLKKNLMLYRNCLTRLYQEREV